MSKGNFIVPFKCTYWDLSSFQDTAKAHVKDTGPEVGELNVKWVDERDGYMLFEQLNIPDCSENVDVRVQPTSGKLYHLSS